MEGNVPTQEMQGDPILPLRTLSSLLVQQHVVMIVVVRILVEGGENICQKEYIIEQ